jgi:hypothetical protein
VLATAPARADDNPAEADACFTAAERAQPLMKEQRLREARAELEMCARDVCPRVARTDCRGWLADVAGRQPSIVISAQEINPQGNARDLTGVRAIIDGGIVLDKVDATAVSLDPGKHRVRVERAGLSPLEQSIELRDGEKNRTVRFSWQTKWVAVPKTPTESSTTARPLPAGFYLMGVLGVGALGVGGYLEGSGFSKRSSLNTCKGTCQQSQVDDARNTMLYGDIGLGVGVALLAGAAVVYFTRPTEPAEPTESPPATTSGARRARPEVGWSIGPISGGVMAGIHGNL